RRTKRGASRSGAGTGCSAAGGTFGGTARLGCGGGLGGITGRFGTACSRALGNPSPGGSPPACATIIVGEAIEPFAVSPALALKTLVRAQKRAAIAEAR